MEPMLKYSRGIDNLLPVNRPMHTSDYLNALQDSIPREWLPIYETWTCNQWIDFHKKLKAHFIEKGTANQVWNGFWNNKPRGLILGEKCVADTTFKDYFNKEGIQFDNNLYSYISQATGFLSSISGTARTLVIAGLVIGGILVVLFIGYQIYNAVTMRNIAVGGLRKAANNPELVGEGIGAGLKL